jgi:hypothetical protein
MQRRQNGECRRSSIRNSPRPLMTHTVNRTPVRFLEKSRFLGFRHSPDEPRRTAMIGAFWSARTTSPGSISPERPLRPPAPIGSTKSNMTATESSYSRRACEPFLVAPHFQQKRAATRRAAGAWPARSSIRQRHRENQAARSLPIAHASHAVSTPCSASLASASAISALGDARAVCLGRHEELRQLIILEGVEADGRPKRAGNVSLAKARGGAEAGQHLCTSEACV